MIPEPTEQDVMLNMEGLYDHSHFLQNDHHIQALIRRCHAAEKERDELRGQLAETKKKLQTLFREMLEADG